MNRTENTQTVNTSITNYCDSHSALCRINDSKLNYFLHPFLMKRFMKAVCFTLKMYTFMRDKLLLNNAIIVKMNSHCLGCFSNYISAHPKPILDQCLKQYFTLSTKHLLMDIWWRRGAASLQYIISQPYKQIVNLVICGTAQHPLKTIFDLLE